MPAYGLDGPIARDAIAAVLFLQSANMTYQAFGTLNSSPWTIENVGADEEKARSMNEYNLHAAGSALFFAVIAAAIAGRHWIWPLLGVVVVNLYLLWVYRRGLRRARKAGSDGSGWFDVWGKS